MRALMLASFFPKPGNATMGVWALRQAHALRDQGIEVEVVSLTSWVPRAAGRLVPDRLRPWARCPPAHDWDGLRVHYPRWPRYDRGPHRRWATAHPGAELALAWPFARRFIQDVAADVEPDVVYAHAAAVSGWVGARLARERGLPLVVHEHDNDEIDRCADLPARRRLYRQVLGGAAAVIAPSRSLAARIERQVPGVRVRVIPNGADVSPQPRARGAGGRTVVLCAAGFYPRKGVPTLVEAFARVAQRHSGAVLRIVGDGADRPAVQRAIAASGAWGRVELLGFRPHADVLREMAEADVFALVSWNEPFGVVFAEAMAAGAPVVCTSDAGITDVLEDGVHGFVVPPRDVASAARALDRLLGDSALRQRMGAAGADLVRRRLTWAAHARALADELEGVLRMGTGGYNRRLRRPSAR